jgi:hypothetical protein
MPTMKKEQYYNNNNNNNNINNGDFSQRENYTDRANAACRRS